ncbi:MAG: hypothetical protein HY259_13815, partial [Chloroflexi bacterium]|nr:hypothetical protein [Chloroflexota bacterium]
EGPPPQFAMTHDDWMTSVQDTTGPYEVARCETRTFSGPKMIKRCRTAWDQNRPVILEYRDLDGMKQRVEICGVRFEALDEGTLLQLWVRMPVEIQLIEIDQNDDDADDDE